MKENKLKVSFFVQAKRTDKKGLAPVIGRISVGKTHSGFSTKCKTPLSLWDSRKQRLIGKSAMAVSVNQKLGECAALIHSRFHELSEREVSITATDVRDAYQGQIHRQALLLESFGDYLAQTKERIGIDRALKTFKLRTYQFSLLREYVQKKHKVSDIPLSQLDKAFIEGFEYFLTIDRRLKRGSVSSALSSLQTIVRMAVKKGALDFYLKSERNLSLATIQIVVIFLRRLIGIGQQKKYIRIDPFVDYKAERPHRTRRYLTTEELQRILQTPILDRQFERARQLFLFCAFTGLARVDMQRLKPKHIIHNADGTEEIRIKRQKTDVEAIIPLLPIARQILSLYVKDKKADDLIFPNLTIRKASFACVNIGQICRIEKGLTFHMARHTFSTTICLSNGISMETLSKMLGHSNIGTTQIYGKITDHKIQEDMTALTDREHSAFEDYCKSIARQSILQQQE